MIARRHPLRVVTRAGRPRVSHGFILIANPRAPRGVTLIGNPRASRGFTLVEILVVVVIVGVLALALTIAVGGGGERKLANESERFQSLLAHACSEAELGGREIGVVVGDEGYAFRRLDGADWHAQGGDELRDRRWPSGLRFELRRDGRVLELASPKHPAPQLVCFSSGEMTAFELTLALGDTAATYRIRGNEDGRLDSERIEVAR
jgi:general secretion pathway protein H